MLQLGMLLAIVLGTYGVLFGLTAWTPRFSLGSVWRGRISLALLFLFTGASHFFMTEEMAQMLPPFVPQRETVIYLTGVLEILGAVGLLIPRLARWASLALIAFLFAVLPANIYSALNYVDFGAHADGPIYLLARVPFQLFLAGWAYYFGVRTTGSRTEQAVPAGPSWTNA